MIELLLALVALAVVAVLAAWTFRRLGLLGEGIMAGLLVGILFGPTVLGRIAPTAWETVAIGAHAERAAVDAAVSEQQAFKMAAAAAGQSTDQVEAGLAERDAEIRVLADAAAAAVARHARPWTIATTVLAVLAFWLGWTGGRPTRRDDRNQGEGGAVFALGCWVALLPAFVTILVFRLLGYTPTDPMVLATAACLAVAGWPVVGEDARRLDRLRLRGFVTATSAFATILAAMIALVARLLGGPTWALVALPLLVFRFGPSPRTIRNRGRLRRFLRHVVLPTLAALAACRSEVLLETPWLVTIGLLLVAGDVRAFGWMIGLRFAGIARPAPDDGDERIAPELAPDLAPDLTEKPEVARPSVGWTTSLTASGAAGAQLSFAAIAVALGAIDTGLAFALVLAAAGIDVFSPARRRLAVGN